MVEELAIHISRVSKNFGSVTALDGVDLDVATGTVMALLGPNGAGKTTLVRILTTLLLPDSGVVQVGSHDVLREPQSVRMIIGLTCQNATIDENLTGRENLELIGRLYHLDLGTVRRRTAELLESFGLSDAADRPSKTYSGGMRRRLDLAASLVGKPKILFLDEPTTGLDPKSRSDMWGTIEGLVSEGVTVLLTTQYLEEADYLADRIAVIDQGRIIATGAPEELKSKIGGDVIEMRLTDRSKAAEAAESIRRFGAGEPTVEDESGIVTLPVDRGPNVLVDVVRELDASHLAIADLNFRRPSLDEVFLTLTGNPAANLAENPAGNGLSGGNGRRRRQ